ncbi:hypothetical protein K1719_022933 [Acacia pycnantha]|nr:hypothetical protein K1719_022933 [Acacia pycnantha]
MASQFLRRHKRKTSFFKVLINDFSTRLQIPPSFIKEFGKDGVPKRTTLETYNCKYWEVGVEKLGNKFYFNNGWDKFVQDNSLENGDFLVLKYFADYSKFKVRIYGKTCCEKQLNLVTGERCREPLNGEQVQRNEQARRKRNRRGEENDANVNKDRESKAFKSDVTKLESDGSYSSFDDDDDDEQEIGKLQNASRIPPDYHNYIKFESEHKHFHLQLKYSSANQYLHLPTNFFEEHMKENEWIMLEVSKKTWKMEIRVYEDKRPDKRKKDARVTNGWKRLVKERHLKIGDICFFEMINKCYDSDHSAFHVHVYRWDHQKGEFSKII